MDDLRRRYFAGEITAEEYVKAVLESGEAGHERQRIMADVERLLREG